MEGPDDYISLPRAAQIAGLSVNTIRAQVRNNKLKVVQFGTERLTTRKWLHEYLTSRDERRQQSAPLPEDYQAPE